MQLPNKLYSYKDSTLALLPVLLKKLGGKSIPASELYSYFKNRTDNPTEFLSVMDCAYALNAIDINEDGEVYSCLSK